MDLFSVLCSGRGSELKDQSRTFDQLAVNKAE